MNKDLATTQQVHKYFKKNFVLIVFASIFSCLIGWNLIESSSYIWLVLLGLLILVLVLTNNESSLIIITINIFILDWLSDVYHSIPRQITWANDLVLLFLLLSLGCTLAVKKKFYFTFVEKLMLLLLCIGGISSALNLVGIPVLLAGIRNYFKYFILYLVVMNLDFKKEYLKKVFKLLIFFAFLQIPVAMWQSYKSGRSGDFVGGTLGANTSGILTVFLLCVISILISLYLLDETSPHFFFASSLLFVPMALNETKVTFVLLIVWLLFYIFRKPRKVKLNRYILFVSLSVAVTTLLLFTYSSLFGKDILYQKNLTNYLFAERTKSGELNRFAQLKFAHENLLLSPQTYALGFGLGNASESFFNSGTGYYFRKYAQYKIDSLFLSRVMWEFGYLGVILYCALFLRLFRLAEKIQSDFSLDNFDRALAHGFSASLLVLVMTTIYINSILIDALAFLFWFSVAYLNKLELGK